MSKLQQIELELSEVRRIKAGSIVLGSYGVPAVLLWGSTVNPDNDASERLLEVSELDGKIYLCESLYTKQPDIVL